MPATTVLPRSSVNWRRLGIMPLIVAILLAMLALPGPTTTPPRVHEALLKLAASQPTMPVNVIVQRAVPGADLAPLVGRLGGRILRELPLIKAAVVTLPAQAVLELGRTAEVRWVSLDAPMASHTCQDRECADTSGAIGTWIDAVRLRNLWQARPEIQGQGVNIAVIDSGIAPDHQDYRDRIVRNVAAHHNLVLNGDFEDALSGWSAAEGAASARLSDGRTYGGYYGYRPADQVALYHPEIQYGSPPISMVQRLHAFIPGMAYTLRASGKIDGRDCESREDNWVGVRGMANGKIWGTGFAFCESHFETQRTQFVVPEGTEYVEVATVQNSTRRALLVDEISVAPAFVDLDGGSVLVGFASTTPAHIDLSAEGGLDWYVRGLNSDPRSVNRREGPPRIAVRPVGRFEHGPFDQGGPAFAWSDGTPTASWGGTTGGVAVVGRSRGFQIRVPATTELRTLRVYLTLRNTDLDVYGYLSDGSVLPFTDLAVDTEGYADGLRRVMYTFTYRATRNAQTLKVRFVNNAPSENRPTVVFHAATLAEGSTVPIATTNTTLDAGDQYGHGTLMAGLIAGDGAESDGAVVGVAPRAGLVNVRILDANGEATVSDVIRGLEWIYQNHERYNIRIVNISLNSNVAESHLTSPLSAAVEILWINKIVVVVSAGNNGNNGVLYPPANDPLVITAGSVDHDPNGSPRDALAPFSALGVTDVDNAPKPEIVAPGVNLVGAGCPVCLLNQTYAQNVPSELESAKRYFRASGTSLSAAIVSGAAALVLQASPDLDPDQVKYRLMSTGGTQFGHDRMRYLDIYAAVTDNSTLSANQNRTVSELLYTGGDALANGSVNWGSVNWGSVNWGSVNWGSTSMASSMRASVSSMSHGGPDYGLLGPEPPLP